MGLVSGAIGALLYNLFARWVGGFGREMDVPPQTPMAPYPIVPLTSPATNSSPKRAGRLMTDLATTDLATHYFDEARRQLRGNKRLAEAAIAQLKDEELFFTLDPESNSIAILVKHLAGNMRSRFTDFLTTDGEKPDRFRDQEFELNAATTRADVMRWWEEGWEQVFTTLNALKPEDVMRTVTIRGEPHTVLQAINRQIAHYASHSGQIILLAKHLRSKQWKTLSIPRGKSEDYKRAAPKAYKPAS
jgi:hypothetical protein